MNFRKKLPAGTDYETQGGRGRLIITVRSGESPSPFDRSSIISSIKPSRYGVMDRVFEKGMDNFNPTGTTPFPKFISEDVWVTSGDRWAKGERESGKGKQGVMWNGINPF